MAESPKYPKRVIAALVLVSLAVGLWQLPAVIQKRAQLFKPSADDGIARYIERIRKVKPLPPTVRSVGYVTDGSTVRTLPGGQLADTRLLAQYALTPVIVEASQKPELVIGDFTNAVSSAYLEALHLEVVYDCGQGLYLLRRSGK